MKKTARISLFLIFGVLLLAALACKQSGEIITSAEATQRAIPSVTPTQEVSQVAGAEFSTGDDIIFAGKGYLISVHANPGDNLALSHAARGDAGTIISSLLYEGEIWYQVESVAGDGWVNADSVQAPE
ncbi:MAG: hypothetical protein HN855_07900 [Anaerolineae bacterium]|jgi:hypothetical protein|nr:hypothetical protein [Anaerolineae bacterium]MBT7069888.1 hypothetical protein [Anaerolineae bacterium]MBT7325064.1 hypothetical protein [Anaerolineae bacterium]